MVQFGDIELLIRLNKTPLNGGRVRLCFVIETSAKKYRQLHIDPVSATAPEQDIEGVSFSNWSDHDSYGFKLKAQIIEWRRLISATVSEVIQACWKKQLLNLGHAQQWRRLEQEAIRALQSGENDTQPRVELIDLAARQRAEVESALASLRASRILSAQREQEAAAAREILRKRQAYKIQFEKEAKEAAFKLLFSRLTPEERQEAETQRQITVRNHLGKFVIPIDNGLVNRYEREDKYVASYCIVYRDPTIPAGDVALM